MNNFREAYKLLIELSDGELLAIAHTAKEFILIDLENEFDPQEHNYTGVMDTIEAEALEALKSVEEFGFGIEGENMIISINLPKEWGR